MDAGSRKKGISIVRRKRRFIQFESHTRLLALIITLSVGYLGPWDLGAVVVVVQWVGACKMAAGSRIGELDKEGDVGAELAPRRVE